MVLRIILAQMSNIGMPGPRFNVLRMVPEAMFILSRKGRNRGGTRFPPRLSIRKLVIPRFTRLAIGLSGPKVCVLLGTPYLIILTTPRVLTLIHLPLTSLFIPKTGTGAWNGYLVTLHILRRQWEVGSRKAPPLTSIPPVSCVTAGMTLLVEARNVP